jgi:hypothetical protein
MPFLRSSDCCSRTFTSLWNSRVTQLGSSAWRSSIVKMCPWVCQAFLLRMTPGSVVEHVGHATFLPGRMLRSTPPQTPNRSSRSSAAWRHSTSTGQRLHHLTAIARWAASSAVHSSRVMGSLQRGRSPEAARDSSARLSPSVAVMGWPALGVRRRGRFRGVNTLGRRRRFNLAAPKAGEASLVQASGSGLIAVRGSTRVRRRRTWKAPSSRPEIHGTARGSGIGRSSDQCCCGSPTSSVDLA